MHLMQTDSLFIDDIKQMIGSARHKAYSAINLAQVEANWLIGQRIVLQEQAGKERAEYGKFAIKMAAEELKKEFGSGFSFTNIKNFKKFYLYFSHFQIGQTVSDLFGAPKESNTPALLSWSHYERLIRVEYEQARTYYLKEASPNMW